MPDIYDALIRQYGPEKAAPLLASACRKKDQTIERLRLAIRRNWQLVESDLADAPASLANGRD